MKPIILEKTIRKAKTFINTEINGLIILDIYPNYTGIGKKIKATYKCKCGKVVENSNFYAIRNGEIQRCNSCARKLNTRSPKKLAAEKASRKYEGLIGQTVNSLSIISYTNNGKFRCKCSCGKEIMVSSNHVAKGTTKSCGCLSSYYHSIGKGCSGIPYETKQLNKFIRQTPEYSEWVKLCLANADYTCIISKIKGRSLVIHHITPLHKLIELFNITKDNYKEPINLKILFDPKLSL